MLEQLYSLVKQILLPSQRCMRLKRIQICLFWEEDLDLTQELIPSHQTISMFKIQFSTSLINSKFKNSLKIKKTSCLSCLQSRKHLKHLTEILWILTKERRTTSKVWVKEWNLVTNLISISPPKELIYMSLHRISGHLMSMASMLLEFRRK